jgi:hypothetical protein
LKDQVAQLGNWIVGKLDRRQLAFLGDAQVVFARAFDPVQKLAILFGQTLDDFVKAMGCTEGPVGCKVHKLTGLEFVVGHLVLSFRRLAREPELDQAADRFGAAGLVILLRRPCVEAFFQVRIQAQAYRLADARRRPAAASFFSVISY